MAIHMDGGDRLRATLLNQMSAVESSRSSMPSLTLDAILRAEKRSTAPSPSPSPSPVRSHSNRTLLDIMRDEQRQRHNRDKITWKTFRDRLRLKRAGVAWSSSDIPIPNSDVPIHTSDIPLQVRDSQRFNRLGFLLYNSAESSQEVTQSELTLHYDDSPGVSFPAASPQNPRAVGTEDHASNEPLTREGRVCLGVALAEERALSEREAETAAPQQQPQEEEQPGRMSLMDLLEETDRQMGNVGPIYTLDDVSDDVKEEEEDDNVATERERTAAESGCCVCMTRSKGAAFIPCGHTFCRVCSRELWVQRGNCPLCNSFILEILDIF